MNYIEELKQRIQLKEGKNLIEKALHLVYFYGPISSKLLARELMVPVPVATALKKEGVKLGIWEQLNGIQLTEEGKRYFLEDCGFNGVNKEIYLGLLNNNSVQERLIIELSEKYGTLFESRPVVDVTIDQAKCTVETAFRRAVLCLINFSLIGKKILCVGDDDFISIAMGLLVKYLFPLNHEYPVEIHVLDVDHRYIQLIRSIAKQHSLPIECTEMDLKEPLPSSFQNQYDSFFTDPPYTIDGASLFLSRGISAIKKERGLKAFLSFGNKPVNESFVLQKLITSQGMIIRHIDPSFNQYEGASLLGNKGLMMVLESTDQTKEMIPDDKATARYIYTREIRKPNSVYICKKCKMNFLIGVDKEYKTIEELKIGGCPTCRHNKFEILQKKPTNVSLPSKALGKHILADFYGCSFDHLNDTQKIQRYMHDAAILANASIVQESFHSFDPWGVSGVIVIQESHLTIHTWPEYGYASIDLFTCGDQVNPWRAFDYLKMKLGCELVEYNDISRGMMVNMSSNNGSCSSSHSWHDKRSNW